MTDSPATLPDARVHLSCDEAQRLSMAALRGLGYPEADAALIAGHVLDAALCGYEYSGLAKILHVGQFMQGRPVQGPMRVLQETPVSALLDGANHTGMVAVDRATDLVIAKAQAQGFGIVGVNQTWMSGRSAYFVERIARAGLVGLHAIGSRALAAPPGAAAAAIGTLPTYSPVAGECTSITSEVDGATHLPPMKSLSYSVLYAACVMQITLGDESRAREPVSFGGHLRRSTSTRLLTRNSRRPGTEVSHHAHRGW